MERRHKQFVSSKCDRCGRATSRQAQDGGALFTLPHEWGWPLADQGAFCQRCIEQYDAPNWLAWINRQRPSVRPLA